MSLNINIVNRRILNKNLECLSLLLQLSENRKHSFYRYKRLKTLFNMAFKLGLADHMKFYLLGDGHFLFMVSEM